MQNEEKKGRARKKSPLAVFYILSALAMITALVINILGPAGNFLVGPEIIGDKTTVFKIIGIAAIIVFINFILANFLFKRERFLSYTLSITTLMFSIIVAAAVASYFYF